MKKLICLLLSLVMLLCGTAMAEVSAADVTGVWHADLFGIAAALNLVESGAYQFHCEGIDPHYGTWRLTDGTLLLDEGTENELSLAVSSDALLLSLDGLTFLFTREMPTAFVPAEINEEAAIEQFAGQWSMTHLTSMGLLLDGNVLGVQLSLIIEGTDAAAYLVSADSEEVTSIIMQGSFDGGVLTLTEILPEPAPADDTASEAEQPVPMVWEVRLLADGSMCITESTRPEYPVDIYLTPIMPLMMAE